MDSEQSRCPQTCRQLCVPLESAILREKEVMIQFDSLRNNCPYPEVTMIMNELILQRQKSIRLLEEAKARLKEKFNVLEQIQEGFNIA